MQKIMMLGGNRHSNFFNTENPFDEITFKKNLYEKKEIYKLRSIKSRLFYIFEEIDNNFLLKFIDELEDF